MKNKVAPVNTGKVRIGIYYEPKKRPLSLEETCLQDALLGYKGERDWPVSVGLVLTAVFVCYTVASFLFYLAH